MVSIPLHIGVKVGDGIILKDPVSALSKVYQNYLAVSDWWYSKYSPAVYDSTFTHMKL